jgi:xylulokinase
MDGYAIGVDIGTTATKAVLLGPNSRVVAESARAEHMTSFLPNVPSTAEQDPDDWWLGTVRCIKQVLELASLEPRQVAAVAVSSQAPCVVLVDYDGQPVHPALLWMDRRSDKQCRDRSGADQEIRQLTGNTPDPYYAAPKVAWLLENEPSLKTRVSTVLVANGYVNLRLTGTRTIDTCHAGLTLLAELREVRWSSRLAEIWGIPMDWLPPIKQPTAVQGKVTTEAAAATGLLTGTPVVTGLVDGAAASLEAGVADAGDICEMTGQSTVLNAGVPYEVLAKGIGTLSVCAYPIPGLYLLFGSMVSTGGILRWFRDQFGHLEVAEAIKKEGDPFTLLDELAGTAPVGSGGLILLPYFLGERAPVWDTDARGALVGLSMSTQRADVVRAILEGTAYGLNHNLEEMRKLGLVPPVLRIVGGGARGKIWNQIKADVTGLPVEVPTETIGAPVGSALVAAVGAGLIDDLAQGVRSRYHARDQVLPDMAHHKKYQRYYKLYKELYPALSGTFRRLAQLRYAED